MTGFLDTSSIVKNYIHENGSDKIHKLWGQLTAITIAPTCWLEINSTLYRLARQELISKEELSWLLKEIQKDFQYFHQVLWDNHLEEKSLGIIQKHQLATLDSIQLASASLCKIDVFVTSDKFLFNKARLEFKHVEYIG